MNKNNNNKHEFAFFLENITEITKSLSEGSEIKIENTDLFHRMSHILRLEKGAIFIIFNKKKNIKIELQQYIKKKIISGKIIKKNKNKTLKPNITFLLPILKKDHLQQALYSLVELGANTIQMITTQKSQNVWDKKIEQKSLKIIRSAAEQSKNFAVPCLKKPLNIEKYIQYNINTKDKNCVHIYFDPQGQNIQDVIKNIQTNLDINIMIGPEGDLTKEEKEILKNNEFIFCKLTPTILRSFQAATVGLGIFRSILK